jgi:hypothetical protein
MMRIIRSCWCYCNVVCYFCQADVSSAIIEILLCVKMQIILSLLILCNISIWVVVLLHSVCDI